MFHVVASNKTIQENLSVLYVPLPLFVFQPWEPQCFLREFQHDIISGDSWGDKLILATSAGTFVLEGEYK